MDKNDDKWKSILVDPVLKDRIRFVASVLGKSQVETLRFILSPIFEALVTFDSAECWRDVRLDIPQVNFTFHHGTRRMVLKTQKVVEVTVNE